MKDTAQLQFSWGERFRICASLLAPFALLWLASRRGWIPLNPTWFPGAMPIALLLGLAAPRCFNGWHHGVAAVQSWIGRKLVILLLGFVFVTVLIPVGLCLRLRGKSFLDERPRDSYWQPARPVDSLKDQF